MHGRDTALTTSLLERGQQEGEQGCRRPSCEAPGCAPTRRLGRQACVLWDDRARAPTGSGWAGQRGAGGGGALRGEAHPGPEPCPNTHVL